MEFLVRLRWTVPVTMADTEWQEIRAAERVRGAELMSQGTMKRLWRLPGQRGAVGLFETNDATDLDQILVSFPMHPYTDVVVEALATHPLELQRAEAPGDRP